MKCILLLLTLIPFQVLAEPSTEVQPTSTIFCSDVVEQIQAAASFVSPSNYAVQLTRDKEARLILFIQQPDQSKKSLRWRLIERQEDSLNYCISAQGEGLQLLADMHLSNPQGRYGMPGSGQPRCAGKQPSGIPGSLDIRLWANKELGDSLIYSLPNQAGSRDFQAIIAADNTGAWIILDQSRNNLDDTCYYARGESSKIVENIRGK